MDNELDILRIKYGYRKLVENIWNDVSKNDKLKFFIKNYNEIIKEITIGDIFDMAPYWLELDEIIKRNNNNKELPENLLNRIFNILVNYATNNYDNKLKKEIKIII